MLHKFILAQGEIFMFPSKMIPPVTEKISHSGGENLKVQCSERSKKSDGSFCLGCIKFYWKENIKSLGSSDSFM